ncbi:uncharacterized protein PV07_10860 [Cladophialophora immunda]|uniref:Carrier domain-containing protein n=1 Tax=Cladophialophora immunda TaxID=569365 RepID=A0A0D1Z4R1_9EURO|nr:uncharacterized protein PV07_10860 [Cladophialophora immunda]KIW22576.1 hypothetical protein PV07_10860 [Cladophialophora immunda]
MDNRMLADKVSQVEGPDLHIPIPILHDLIVSSVAQHGDRVAMVCKHQPADLFPEVSKYGNPGVEPTEKSHLQWTHGQLQYGADLLAHALVKRGLNPGSPIAVILSGRVEFHMLLRAAVKLKCPFTPLNLRAPQNPKEIRHMLTLSGAKAVIVEDESVANKLEQNVPDLMREMQVKAMAGPKSTTGSYLSLNELVSSAATDDDFQSTQQALDQLDRQLEDTVFIWFTSGTTALPKAAPHTNKSLTCNIRSWEQAFGLDRKRRWLQILPMNSIVGSSWTLAYLIPGGSVTHVNYNFDVQAIATAIQNGEYTDVLAVPSMIDLLSSSPVLNESLVRGVERIIVGGSKILRSHVEKAFGILKCRRFSPFFGMTEGTSVCSETLHRVPESLEDPIYAGYANPGSKIRICAPEGVEPLPRGVPGEIVQGGLQKIENYLGGQGKDSFFTDGGETWYRCGDQAIMLPNGRIAIVGRYKDMIIRGGMNIASAAVEAIISESTGIDSQVIGIPDEVAGEVPIAVIKYAGGDTNVAIKIQRCVLEKMGPAYAIERVINLYDLGLEDWPKTSSGKVLKRDLRLMVENLLASTSSVQTNRPQNGEYPRDKMQIDEVQLQNLLLKRVQIQGILVSNIDDNFHDAGMDSLLALRLGNAIDRDPELNLHSKLPAEDIFQYGTVRRLAAHLMAHLHGTKGQIIASSYLDAIVDEMESMVEKYGRFRIHQPSRDAVAQKGSVILTGATGSLGAHILAILIARDDVSTIYCPVRGREPTKRLAESLRRRSLEAPKYAEKVKVVRIEAGKAWFESDEATKEALLDSLTLIVHAAWPVNFHLPLASFRSHLRDLQRLIQLSLDVRLSQPACFMFCSSMGVALSTRGQKRIAEEPIMDFRQGMSNGYTQSKLVAEYVVQRAVEDCGALACNLRIGQIVGDTMHGSWNEHEAIPLMIRSALSVGTLPALDMECSWIPVDTLAKAIVEIATFPDRQQPPRLVYNMCSRLSFSWVTDLLPALADAGLKFEAVPFSEWIASLESYSATQGLEAASKHCPAIKLIDFWQKSYGGKEKRHDGGLQFDTRQAEAASRSMASTPDVIKSGLVKVMLDSWMKTWGGHDEHSADTQYLATSFMMLESPFASSYSPIAAGVPEDTTKNPHTTPPPVSDDAENTVNASGVPVRDAGRWTFLADCLIATKGGRYSKDYIIQLQDQIAELRSTVANMQAAYAQPKSPSQPLHWPAAVSVSPSQVQPQLPVQLQASDSLGSPTLMTDDSSAIGERPSKGTPESEPGESLISRLCEAQGRLNSKDDGHLRYFGPTSSLHLTESVTSIFKYCSDVSKFGADFEKDVPWALQQYLLDLYWKYQHNILHIIHKEAFIAGMQTQQGPYFSRCLLLCLLASAARISVSPEIRALSVPADDDETGEKPILTRQAEEALEEELLNPGLTTIQSLMLLSIIDCCQSNDSRGWMRSGALRPSLPLSARIDLCLGNACRLAFDLGLHQNWSRIPNTKLSALDLEVRQVILWGCVGFDRLWSLYLGRPPVIKLSDVSIDRPHRNAPTWDMKMFAAWAELLELSGHISEKLNTNTCFQEQIDFFTEALQRWDASLDHTLTFFPNAPPGIYLLRIQYSALTILVNRHNAGYGNPEKRNCQNSNRSRRICLEHAFTISNLVLNYATHHGEANTMLGSALYNITMAATIFVAEINERNRQEVSDETAALATCLKAMKEMESAEIVARNLRRILQTIMRVCRVCDVPDFGEPMDPPTEWQRPKTGTALSGTDATVTTLIAKRLDDSMNDSDNDFTCLNFDPVAFDSVFQLPFDEALLDPSSVSAFLAP